MSVQSEITRLETAKTDLAAWLTANGVTVPDGTNLTGLVELLEGLQMGSNKNLLHNWDFRNPVNQRGVTSLAQDSTLKYFIDRWQVWDGTFAVTDNGLQVAWNGTSGYNARMRQRIEQKLFGETVTVSAIVDGELYQAALVVPTTADAASYGSTVNGIQFMVQNHGNAYFSAGIVINETATRIVRSMKCEIGSVSTSLQDAPADYGEQLALCQRYCIATANSTTFLRATYGNANSFYFTLPIPVSMRTNPSVESFARLDVSKGVNEATQTGFTFAFVNLKHAIRITATKSNHGLSDARLNITSLVLSAEL